jgi:hypothetical protein
MSRKPKTLLRRLQDGTFLVRRHSQLLSEEALPIACPFADAATVWNQLRAAQRAYQAATRDRDRVDAARGFEAVSRKLVDADGPSLADVLQGELGSEFGGEMFARFCETFLVQTIGRWDAQPLVLEPWAAGDRERAPERAQRRACLPRGADRSRTEKRQVNVVLGAGPPLPAGRGDVSRPGSAGDCGCCGTRPGGPGRTAVSTES